MKNLVFCVLFTLVSTSCVLQNGNVSDSSTQIKEDTNPYKLECYSVRGGEFSYNFVYQYPPFPLSTCDYFLSDTQIKMKLLFNKTTKQSLVSINSDKFDFIGHLDYTIGNSSIYKGFDNLSKKNYTLITEYPVEILIKSVDGRKNGYRININPDDHKIDLVIDYDLKARLKMCEEME